MSPELQQIAREFMRRRGRETLALATLVRTTGSSFLQPGARMLIAQSGDEDVALAAYVQGQGSIASEGIFPETWQYVANVRAIQDYIARYGEPPN